MTDVTNYTPFYVFDQTIQEPFSSGMVATVNAAMAAVQGPLTALIVLYIIISGILVMRGDVDARKGVTRIISVSLIVGILMSTTLYNEYVVSFFSVGIPDWLASSLLGVTGSQPTAHQFDQIWADSNELIRAAQHNLNFYNVLYSVELALLQVTVIFPVALTFLIYETTRIMVDIIVSIGPFLLAGYLFTATRGIADRWIGKLIGLTILTLLIDVVLSIIIHGDASYFAVSMTSLTGATVVDSVMICLQFLGFITLGSLICCFLPAVASYLGGGIAVSPLGMAASAMHVGQLAQSVRSKPASART